MNDGMVSLMFFSKRETAVTEPLVQLTSAQVQWSEDEVQWLSDGGFNQCSFSLIKMDFS